MKTKNHTISKNPKENHFKQTHQSTYWIQTWYGHTYCIYRQHTCLRFFLVHLWTISSYYKLQMGLKMLSSMSQLYANMKFHSTVIFIPFSCEKKGSCTWSSKSTVFNIWWHTVCYKSIRQENPRKKCRVEWNHQKWDNWH